MVIEVKDNSLDFNSINISCFEEEEEEEQEEEELEFDDEEDEKPVTLGFVEKPKDHYSLLRHFFLSKAGGASAWLDPVDLQSEKSHICGICGEPLQFLLQVYAPIVHKESTFHRTLFVFMCTSMTCLLQEQHEQWKRRPEKQLRSVKVFRCQLPRSNPFYSIEPPRNANTDKPLGPGASLCQWCGAWKGDKVCSSCKSAHYCSEKHPVKHWRSGHKAVCQMMSISSLSSDHKPRNQRNSLNKEGMEKSRRENFLSSMGFGFRSSFSIFLIPIHLRSYAAIIPALPIVSKVKSVALQGKNRKTRPPKPVFCGRFSGFAVWGWFGKPSNRELRFGLRFRSLRKPNRGLHTPSDMWPEFEIICDDEPEFDTEASKCSYSNSLVSKDQVDGTMNSLLSSFEGDTDKRSWASFQELIARAPEQVLRYARDAKAKPLWPMSSGQPSKADIPNCNYCTGPLCYEFQILPQLLYYFGVKNDADSLDWGTIVVYACADSCNASVAYKEEFAWVQLSSSTALVP